MRNLSGVLVVESDSSNSVACATNRRVSPWNLQSISNETQVLSTKFNVGFLE